MMTEFQRAFHLRELKQLVQGKALVEQKFHAAQAGTEEARAWAAVQFATCARIHDVRFLLNQDVALRQEASASVQIQPAVGGGE